MKNADERKIARRLMLVFAMLLWAQPSALSALDMDDDDEPVDMDLLLDVLKRTRGPPPAPHQQHLASPFSGGSKALFNDPFGRVLDDPLAGLDSLLSRKGRGFDSGLRGVRAEAAKVESSRSQRPPPGKFRKDSVDADSLRTRKRYQAMQADRIRQAYKEGKPQEMMLTSHDFASKSNISTEVSCALDFYQEAYGIVGGCTPGWTYSPSNKGNDPTAQATHFAAGDRCMRRVVDGFGTAEEMRDMVTATEKAMENLFHQGGSTSLAPASSLERLGTKGALLFQLLLAKVKLQLVNDFGLSVIYDSGALLTRLKADAPVDEWDMEPGHVYWNPHVDKANIPTYDYSALLYLNSHGSDFEGGEFSFIDNDADRIVQPRPGRLLFFTSGPENLHQVREVTKGTRYVLAMWFTCSKDHQYKND